MVRADVIFLIGENPEAHGAFDPHQQTKRMVYATVRSVGMTETLKAKSLGLSPEYVFDLADYSEYQGEKQVEYNGTTYSVFRTYTKGQRIELTVMR